MPSPFPGMDPYLEGYLWPDVHQALASEIRRQLAQKIWPRYVARMVIRFVAEDLETHIAIGRVIPDVEVLHRPRRLVDAPSSASATLDIPQAPYVVALPASEGVKLASIEIQDAISRDLVTSIEILSPVNKRGAGYHEYQSKRKQVMSSQAHLLELDWLREGQRPIIGIPLPIAPYGVFLTRSPAYQLEVWPIQLQDPLPIVPVPLRAPDPAVTLDLQAVLTQIYDDAHYEGDIDYRQPPDPPLMGADAQWATEFIQQSLSL